MKNSYILFITILFSVGMRSQNYTWMRGAAINGTITGVYGTQGVSSPFNDPGSRHGAATWVDAAGNLWMFGGEGFSSVNQFKHLNDLWKYNVATNQWTWIRGSNLPNQLANYGTQGVSAPSNEPGAREFANSWVDASGNFWLFGGDGYTNVSTPSIVRLGDLWKYNPATNEWTFMKGFTTANQNGIYGTMGTPAGTNLPGARYGAGTFVNSTGKLMLFGGRGFAATGGNDYLNDMWLYDPATNNWTWVNGSSSAAQNGNYGTLNTPSPSNSPGSREFTNYWKLSNGNFMIFGGRGLAATGSPAYLNDQWIYDPSTNVWTWIKGSQVINQVAVYGTTGVPASGNLPGARMSAACWKDLSGNIYVYGGMGYAATFLNRLNDIFKYDPSTNEWAFLKGATVPNQPGVYGTMGVQAPTNIPGSREFNTWWTAPTGHFWLFGGEGKDSTNNPTNNMNDLWRYIPACSPDSVLASGGSALCSGKSATITAYNQYPSSVSWYTSATGGTAISNGSVLTTSTLNAASGQSVYTYYAEANTCTTSPRAVISVTVNPLPALSLAGPTTACTGGNVTVTANGAVNYLWSIGMVGSTISVPCSAGNVTVVGTDINGCQGYATANFTCVPPPAISITTSHSLVCRGNSVTLTGQGASTYLWNNGFTTPTISVAPLTSTPYTVTGTAVNSCTGTAVFTQSVSPCAGFEGHSGEGFITVYPNPSGGEVSFVMKDHSGVKLLLFNAIGQIVSDGEFINGVINYKGLRAGLYLYRITQNDNVLKEGKLIVN